MLLYFLAGIGALTVVLILLILLSMFFGWLGQPVNYVAQPDEIQRYLRSWGYAISDGGRILVARRGTDQSVTLVKRHSRRVGARFVFRVRNADSTRQHFEEVASALAAANIEFEMERTPTGRPRATLLFSRSVAIHSLSLPRPMRREWLSRRWEDRRMDRFL